MSVIIEKIRGAFVKTRCESFDEFILISHTRPYIHKDPYKLSGKKSFLCKFFCLLVFIIIALLCYYIYEKFSSIQNKDDLNNEVDNDLPPSNSKLYTFDKAAIVTNGGRCAKMAKNILLKGGNAVDAAITGLLCDGISCPQNMGLGGGFLMTIYHRNTTTAISINAREKAPSKASVNMFNGNPKASQRGPLASGVPGELRGYWEVYKKYGGKVPWKDLFTEVIDLANTGIPISPHLAKNIEIYEGAIRQNPTLTSLFINDKNQTKTTSDFFIWKSIANTLSIIANEGGDALHNGSLTKNFVKDIQDGGGIITEQDMNNYDVQFSEPIIAKLKYNQTLYTSPLPGSGIILSFLLKLLENLIPAPSELLWHQRFTEAMKYAYAYRGYLGDNNPNINNSHLESINEVINELQDDEFINKIRSEISDTRTWQNIEHYNGKFLPSEDHGTANLVVISPEGDAVVTTSTVNLVFGSRFVSNSTGIILNNEMDDFSSPNITNYFNVPPSPSNFIQPNKRPLSSMCPSIITNKFGDVILAVGAAGGTKITTSVAQVIISTLWNKLNIKQSVDAARIHHQLYPMKYGYEYGIKKSIIKAMRNIGHVTIRLPNVFTSSITAIAGIEINNTRKLNSNADFRRPGASEGF